ncbi:MAG: hypothetical protein RR978_07105 [Oscillospiraceae bacterium]
MKNKKTKLVVCIAVIALAAVGAYLVYYYTRPAVPVGATAQPQAVGQKPVPDELKTASELAADSAPIDGDANTEKQINGTITDVSTSVIIIKDEKTNEDLHFMRETATVTGRLTADSAVELYYTGTISGSDTTNAYVTRIIVMP